MGLAISLMQLYVMVLTRLSDVPLAYRHSQNTNIVQFCTTLEKGDKDLQMVYYQVRLKCSMIWYQTLHNESNVFLVWRRDMHYSSSRDADPSSPSKIHQYGHRKSP